MLSESSRAVMVEFVTEIEGEERDFYLVRGFEPKEASPWLTSQGMLGN